MTVLTWIGGIVVGLVLLILGSVVLIGLIDGEFLTMKLFNAIQIATLFGSFPFLINWLWTATFALAGVAFWVALVAYVIFYGWIIYMVFQYLDREEKK